MIDLSPVKYAPWLLDPFRMNSYFALPRTLNGLADTKDETWRITEDALKTEGVSVACMNNDYRVCLLVDQKNSTAGLRISVSTNLCFFFYLFSLLTFQLICAIPYNYCSFVFGEQCSPREKSTTKS